MLRLQKGLSFKKPLLTAYCHTCSTLCNADKTCAAHACILEHVWQLQNACWLSTSVLSVQEHMMCCCCVMCLPSFVGTRACMPVSLRCFCVFVSAVVPWIILSVCTTLLTKHDSCRAHQSRHPPLLRVTKSALPALFGYLACPLSSLLLRCTRSTVSAGHANKSQERSPDELHQPSGCPTEGDQFQPTDHDVIKVLPCFHYALPNLCHFSVPTNLWRGSVGQVMVLFGCLNFCCCLS